MTTTSLLPHKPPLKTRNPVFLRTTYYGSVGRPSNYGRRKSAVELLQETKAFYVKSESVLDTKQELKNTDHLHVRSPTVDVSSSSHYRSPGNGGPVIPNYPFFPMGTCPPYPHHHFENYEHVHLQREFEHFVQQHVNKERKNSASFAINETPSAGTTVVIGGGGGAGGNNNNKSRSQSTKTRRSTLPPGTLQLHIQMQKDVKNMAGNNIIGLPLPFAPVVGQQISSTSPRSIEKHVFATLPTVITSPSSSSTLPNHGSGGDKLDGGSDNPPPLPPKSPRTTSKPVRPQDFPQRLPVQGIPDIQPPPPPRRLMSHENGHHQESNIQSKLRRLLHDGPGGVTTIVPGSVVASAVAGDGNLVPITLPSPILPPTPPPDIAMESPMSDSGPILSPPPAFWNEASDSTNGSSKPVAVQTVSLPPTRLDRQNSSASEKSSQKHQPLSAALSTVSVSSMSSRNSRKSVPDLSESMRYSSSSPMSPDDDVDDIEAEEEDDDDSSAKAPPISKTRLSTSTSNGSSQQQQQHHQKKKIPKSVTENALCKFSLQDAATTTTPPRLSSHSNEVSPNRRPILRSKSDLSHRYIKSGSSSNLLGGFTLVHVDLGLPPPLPPHQNNSHHPPQKHYHHHQSKQSADAAVGAVDAFNNSNNSSRDSPNLGKKRNSKSSLELERFFDKLGLDNTPPPTTVTINKMPGGDRSGGSSPVFFSSVSSVDSGPRRGGSIDSGDSPLGVKVGSRTVGGGYNAPVASTTSSSSIVIHHGEPSIVERNARVIKWLFNCRKAVDKR